MEANYEVILMPSDLINDLNGILTINLNDLTNEDNRVSLIYEIQSRKDDHLTVQWLFYTNKMISVQEYK